MHRKWRIQILELCPFRSEPGWPPTKMRVQPPVVVKEGNRSYSVRWAALTAAFIFITGIITPVILNETLIFHAMTAGIDSSQVSDKLCKLWRRKILSGSLCVATQSFVATHADTCRCTSVVLFLESDVAVVWLITVRTAQIWGRKIASEVIALNARSQDFGGDW